MTLFTKNGISFRKEKSTSLNDWDEMMEGIDFAIESETEITPNRNEVLLKLLFDPKADPALFWRLVFYSFPP